MEAQEHSRADGEESLQQRVDRAWVFWELAGGITRERVLDTIGRARRDSKRTSEIEMLEAIADWIRRGLQTLNLPEEPMLWRLADGAWEVAAQAGGLTKKWTAIVMDRARRGMPVERDILALRAINEWLSHELELLELGE